MYFSLIVTSGPGTPTARSSETQTPPICLVFITDEINIKARIKMFDRKRILDGKYFKISANAIISLQCQGTKALHICICQNEVQLSLADPKEAPYP